MTELSKLYDSFLFNISDYNFLINNITEEELEDLLFDYLNKAIPDFPECKQSLEVVEVNGEKFIESDLTRYEIEILSSLMLVAYMKQTTLASENLKQSLSDKDFKIYSQANQLRELRLLWKTLESEVNKKKTKYSYFGMKREDYNAN